jgi:hypothetical protein
MDRDDGGALVSSAVGAVAVEELAASPTDLIPAIVEPFGPVVFAVPGYGPSVSPVSQQPHGNECTTLHVNGYVFAQVTGSQRPRGPG